MPTLPLKESCPLNHLTSMNQFHVWPVHASLSLQDLRFGWRTLRFGHFDASKGFLSAPCHPAAFPMQPSTQNRDKEWQSAACTQPRGFLKGRANSLRQSVDTSMTGPNRHVWGETHQRATQQHMQRPHPQNSRHSGAVDSRGKQSCTSLP